MKCPRCQHVFSATPDAGGIVTCPSCSSRLRTRPAAAVAAAAAAAGPRPAPAPVAPAPAAGPTRVKTSPVAAPVTLPSAAPAAAARPAPAPDPVPGLDAILDELRALRDGQQEILELLRQPQAASPRPEPFGSFSDEAPAPAPPVRTRRRKTVLIIDDDPDALAAAVEALERAEVPTRAVSDGNTGLAAIAEEKPDVLVMELGLKGAMGGKDVINMIKATMEWVDVPIVLYTRMPIESQREARQIHGADEYVLKGPGSPDALVVRVIAVFRKG
jgi:CheY-like chemotaxis protein